MAADAYIKVAASQLQQAASAVKQDAEHMRAEFSSYKQQTNHDISNMQSEMHQRQIEAMRFKTDPPTYAAMMTNVKRIEQDMNTKKQELAQRTSEVEQIVRSKEGAVQGIQSQAQGLERQASDPKLR